MYTGICIGMCAIDMVICMRADMCIDVCSDMWYRHLALALHLLLQVKTQFPANTMLMLAIMTLDDMVL